MANIMTQNRCEGLCKKKYQAPDNESLLVYYILFHQKH